jgi:hypothetical protein
MNRLYHGMAVLVIWVVGSSCGDPTGDLRGGPDRVAADPSALFLDQGETQNVIIRVLDEQGNEGASTVTNIMVSPADLATVTIDSSFLAGTDTTRNTQIPDPTRTQLVVTAGSRAAGFIEVTASGLKDTIPVRVLPVATEFDATFSNQVPALAEQVTVTAPAGFTFTDSSVVTFAGVANPIITARGGNTLTFLPSPNSSGVATITEVVPSYAPNLSLDFTTVDTIGVTPRIDTLLATYTTTTPPSSQPVTVTAPAGFRFQPAAVLTVAGVAAIVNSRAADSSSITFQVTPGTIGPVKIDSVIVSAVPQFPLSLPTRDSIVAGPLAPLAGTTSTGTAPNFNAPGVGGSLGIFDAPDFPANIDRYYKLTVAEAGDYVITTDWSIGSDVDQLICINDASCSAPDIQGATAAHPETATVTLPAGTSYIWIEDFGGDAAGASVTITIDHLAPAGP